jgi:transposase
MKAYSKDLRRKIVNAIERGMPKAQAARTFGVGISTVKRYAAKVQRGESLEPGKAPSKAPKIDEGVGKLLEADLEERPFATLPECVEGKFCEPRPNGVLGSLASGRMPTTHDRTSRLLCSSNTIEPAL